MHFDQPWSISNEKGNVLDKGTGYIEIDEELLTAWDLAKDFFSDHPEYEGVITIWLDGDISTWSKDDFGDYGGE